ncbi:MAG TPA: CoA pyrophosphatase [Dehalococcoidia bacterium]|nr:CoA pyrophosphatase [Dehalococcoidia bacterium]
MLSEKIEHTKDRIQRALCLYQPAEPEVQASSWPAAVLILLYEHQSRIHLVLQKRTETVEAHKGQISFPGGGREKADPDLVFTALRETHEEIGVRPEDVEVLGQLDGLNTISGFSVIPFVGWLQVYPYEWVCSDHEVAYLLEVPLDHLSDPANYMVDRRLHRGAISEFPSFRFEGDLIWGATARMVQNFLDVVEVARST